MQPQRHTARQERPERLAGRAPQHDLHGVVRQALAAEPAGHLAAEHRADAAVFVAHIHRRAHRGTVAQGRRGERDQLVVQRLLQPVVLRPDPAPGRVRRQVGHVQHPRQVEPARLPVRHRRHDVQQLGVPDGLGDRAEPERGEVAAHLLGEEQEEVLHELRLAGEALAQHRVLRGDAHRAGVEVADAHHHAALDDQRRGGEAELLGPEQRGDDHVAAGLELAVDLHGHPVTQAVEQQRLLRLGQPQLPRCAGVLERVERGGARTAVVAGDQDHVGLELGDARGDGADSDLRDQFHVYAGSRVDTFQVVDELGQILDGVDVVVRRRGDQPHAGRGVPRLGDPRPHLVAGHPHRVNDGAHHAEGEAQKGDLEGRIARRQYFDHRVHEREQSLGRNGEERNAGDTERSRTRGNGFPHCERMTVRGK